VAYLAVIENVETRAPKMIERETYRLVCLRVGCGWEKECHSSQGARSRALVHEALNPGHRTWMYYSVHDISMGCGRKRRRK